MAATGRPSKLGRERREAEVGRGAPEQRLAAQRLLEGKAHTCMMAQLVVLRGRLTSGRWHSSSATGSGLGVDLTEPRSWGSVVASSALRGVSLYLLRELLVSSPFLVLSS